MSNNLIVVYTAAGQVEANLVKSLLEAEGIEVMVSQEGAGAVYGLTVGALGEARILVAERQAAAARQLIEAWQASAL